MIFLHENFVILDCLNPDWKAKAELVTFNLLDLRHEKIPQDHIYTLISRISQAKGFRCKWKKMFPRIFFHILT